MNPMAKNISQDSIAVRAKPLVSEAPEYVQLLSSYGNHRLMECRTMRALTPDFLQRMTMLANQEYRIMDACKSLQRVCSDLFQVCDSHEDGTLAEVDIAVLLEELNEWKDDLSEYNVQRKDNLDKLLESEKEGLQEFVKLRQDIEGEKWRVRGLGFGATIGIGLAAACPVTLAIGLAVATVTCCKHGQHATKVQGALDADIARLNKPIQYQETLKKNLDDEMKNMKMKSSRLKPGSSARLRSHLEAFEQEIDAIRKASCQNFMGLAQNQTLLLGFGLTELKRLGICKADMEKENLALVSAVASSNS